MAFIKNNLITFSLYYFSTLAVVKLMTDPTQAILVWPAAGIGIVTALVWGYKVIPGLYLAQLAISVLLYSNSNKEFTLHEFYISNLFIAAGMFRCYFGAYLIKYLVGYPNALVSFRAILKFFLIAAPLATLASTFVFDFLKFSLGFINTISFTRNTINWWFGDLLGFAIFAPIALIFISQPKSIWRPRYLTVGLPIILMLISVIFTYNQTQAVDNKRVIENLEIKNKLLASKLEHHNRWINDLLTDVYSHFLIKANSGNHIDDYFRKLKNSDHGSTAIIWQLNDQIHYVKTSSKATLQQIEKYKTYDLTNVNPQYKTVSSIISISQFNEDLKLFVNVLRINRGKESALTVYILHSLNETINQLKEEFELNNTNILLKTENNNLPIIIKKTITRNPEKLVSIESNFKFNDEIWTLINQPSARYLFHNKTNLSSIIAKIGLLFIGLIGIMLLIITGKTSLVDIKVNERTLVLDMKTNKLKESKKQYQDLIEQHPVVLWRLNLKTNKVTYISSKVIKMYGYSLDQWLNEKDFWINHIHHDDQENVRLTIKNSLRKNSGFELKYRFIKSDHSIAWIKDVININHNEPFQQLVGLMVDESETHVAKEGQLISENKYRTLFKHAIDPLIIINLDDNSFRDVNDKAILLFGLNHLSGPVTLADFSTIKQPDGGNSKNNLRKIFRKLEKNKHIDFEWTMINNNHQEIICNIELIVLPQENIHIALANINDITESKSYEKKINQLAYYDNLTKLPNREYFYTKFEYFHNQAVKNNLFGTIIYLDLDRFKILNDSLGHQAGDELLKMVATRIKSVSNKSEFCARLGGDEFVILNKKYESTVELTLENSLVKAELILEALNEPYQLGDYEHYITPSIGISYFPFNNNTIDQIIHQADIAMYSSKDKGKNTITIYQDKMIKNVGKRLKIEKAIRQALTHDEFELYYQPQVNTNCDIFSVEALLRWNRSKEFKINTEDLIDIIEQIGLTHDLGYWVFDKACSQLEDWQLQGNTLSSVAINVSAKQFHQPLFVQQIQSVIQSYNIEPSQIVLELTEAVIIEDMASLIGKLTELKSYGIRTSLDDFGTGYSSLAYLKHLPIDQLKIDKLFIHDLSSDKTSQNIVKMIINLANSMNIELIAEGIEIEEQFNTLKSLGCKHFQGFFFSMPLSANEVFDTEQ